MVKIGLISDTHGTIPERAFDYLSECDEIWHAGDIGSTELIDRLENFKPCRMVYGNIDGTEVRKRTSENLMFRVEGLQVLITHIGGYPGRYSPSALRLIRIHRPGLFISGHSHILKVQYDKQFRLLHMNPGAVGNYGWHQIRTLLRFEIDRGKVGNAQAIELGSRGSISDR